METQVSRERLDPIVQICFTQQVTENQPTYNQLRYNKKRLFGFQVISFYIFDF